MIVLDTTAKSLEFKLGEALSGATELPSFFSWVDVTTTTFTPGSTSNTSNGTTYRTSVVAAPASSTQRQIKYGSVYNIDTITHTVFVRINDGSGNPVLIEVTLQTLDTLVYNCGCGWQVISKTGAISIPAGVSIGDLLYGSAANALSRLAIGTAEKVLKGGTIPSWGCPVSYSTVSGNKTLAATDMQQLWFVTCSGATATMTLPQANTVPAGACVWFKKADGGASSQITIKNNAADTIDGVDCSGANAVVIGKYSDAAHTGQYATYGLMCDGATKWHVIDVSGDCLVNYAASVAAFGTNTAGTITSVVVTPGEWDISGNIVMAGGTTVTVIAGSVNTSVANGTAGDNEALVALPSFSNTDYPLAIPSWTYKATTAQTITLVGYATYGGGTVTWFGRLTARRVR